jgi:hypothetical protein
MKLVLSLLLAIAVSCGFAASYQDYIVDNELELRVDPDGWVWGPAISDDNKTGLIAVPNGENFTIVVFSQNQMGDQVWTVAFKEDVHMVGSMSTGPTVLPILKDDLEEFATNDVGFTAISSNGNLLEIPADYIKHWLKSIVEFEDIMKNELKKQISNKTT